jgi:hypothetical protein
LFPIQKELELTVWRGRADTSTAGASSATSQIIGSSRPSDRQEKNKAGHLEKRELK